MLSEHILLAHVKIERDDGPSPFYKLTNKTNGQELFCYKSKENLYVADLTKEAVINSNKTELFANVSMLEELQRKGFSSE